MGGEKGTGRHAHKGQATDNREAAAQLESGPSQPAASCYGPCCVAFFGFLRSGELTVAESGEFDPGQHWRCEQKVDNTEKPTCVSLQIKQSNTDPFRRGVSFHLHQTNLPLCPVGALLAYLVVRGTQDGPLFQLEDGSPLTRSRLVCELRTALRTADIDPSKYTGHSFRIGAATTAAA